MKRKWIAYHEAGHAVVAAVLDLLRNDTVVSIVSDVRGEDGFVTVPKKAFDFKKRSPRYIRKMILSYYAGPAVSKKLWPQINLFEEGGAFESDMVFAEHLMRYCAPPSCEWIGDSVFQSFKERMWKKAQSLVASRWTDIRSVANALLERKTLTGDEVHYIINRRESARRKPDNARLRSSPAQR